jgi:hypothetical protein
MPVIGVSDLLTMFEWANHHKAARKKAVAEWLDAVFTDLDDLARIWRGLSASLEVAEVDREVERAVAVIRRGGDRGSQIWLAGRLQGFYGAASQVLRDKAGGQVRDDFIQALGKVLLERHKARDILDRQLMVGSLDPANATLHIHDMASAADALQKEVVALQVLIKTFKATNV